MTKIMIKDLFYKQTYTDCYEYLEKRKTKVVQFSVNNTRR